MASLFRQKRPIPKSDMTDNKDNQSNLNYDEFIDTVRNKVYLPNTPLELHHILPKFAGGTNAKENLILLSVEDHTKAHYLRYEQYGEKGDRLAYLLREKMTNKAAIIWRELGIATRKKKKIGFWDSEWQRVQGKKGGPKGGKANTALQFAARSKVGKTFGSQVGKSRQKDKLRQALTHTMIWCHKTGIVVEIPSQETWQMVTNKLNEVVPDAIRNSTSLIKVLYGERKQMYGWSLVGMVIRSEAGTD